ncbi:FxsA family protein [Ornithinimicrobium sp. F0845]|uniref:FxsA family protein n=1 Tax=Ornithinimicrobium sp. F0845 TaxID=2926412 RepID=UPI001FF32153|nr:FxsA family protein [Ornithinimicrobium sp. F0845]MCK0113218.1 FxsA family protein [Ornithinimicrobium sp. F0845]
MARADGLSGPLQPDGQGHGGADGRGREGADGRGREGADGRGRGGTGGRPGPRRRAPYRLRLIFAGVLLLLLLEIVVLITVGRAIGPGWVLLLLLATAVLGAFLVKRESGRAWKAMRGAVDTGRMPGRELADASLVLVGGLLLLLPGFISDALGIFLILPFTRSVSRKLLATLIGARVAVVPGAFGPGAFSPGRRPGPASPRSPSGDASGDIIEGEIIDEDPPPGR